MTADRPPEPDRTALCRHPSMEYGTGDYLYCTDCGYAPEPAPVADAPCTDCPEPDDGTGRAYDVPARETLRVPEYRRHGYQTVGGIKFALAVGSIPSLPDALEVTVEEWGSPMADVVIGRPEAYALMRYLARWLDGPGGRAEGR